MCVHTKHGQVLLRRFTLHVRTVEFLWNLAAHHVVITHLLRVISMERLVEIVSIPYSIMCMILGLGNADKIGWCDWIDKR